MLASVIAASDGMWTYAEIAEKSGNSPSQVHSSVSRLSASKLVFEKKIHRPNFLEFLQHGLKFVFPPVFGPVTRGVATAHSFPSVKKRLRNSEELVWKHPEGLVRGSSLEPVHVSALAASEDTKVHEILAMADILRVGRARERKLAISRLEELLNE